MSNNASISKKQINLNYTNSPEKYAAVVLAIEKSGMTATEFVYRAAMSYSSEDDVDEWLNAVPVRCR